MNGRRLILLPLALLLHLVPYVDAEAFHLVPILSVNGKETIFGQCIGMLYGEERINVMAPASCMEIEVNGKRIPAQGVLIDYRRDPNKDGYADGLFPFLNMTFSKKIEFHGLYKYPVAKYDIANIRLEVPFSTKNDAGNQQPMSIVDYTDDELTYYHFEYKDKKMVKHTQPIKLTKNAFDIRGTDLKNPLIAPAMITNKHGVYTMVGHVDLKDNTTAMGWPLNDVCKDWFKKFDDTAKCSA